MAIERLNPALAIPKVNKLNIKIVIGKLNKTVLPCSEVIGSLTLYAHRINETIANKITRAIETIDKDKAIVFMLTIPFYKIIAAIARALILKIQPKITAALAYLKVFKSTYYFSWFCKIFGSVMIWII